MYQPAHDVATQRDYDRIHQKEDHTPVIADFVGVQQTTATPHHGFRYDKTALRDPVIANKFAEQLNKQPLPD